jgi:hypothetical protein
MSKENSLHGLTLDQLTQAGNQMAGSQRAYDIDLELRRRREMSQQAVDAAQMTTAQAQVDAVAAMRAQVRWTMWSVLVLVAASLVSTVLQLWQMMQPPA